MPLKLAWKEPVNVFVPYCDKYDMSEVAYWHKVLGGTRFCSLGNDWIIESFSFAVAVISMIGYRKGEIVIKHYINVIKSLKLQIKHYIKNKNK